MKHNFCLKSILDFFVLCCMKTHSMKTSPMHGWCVSSFFKQFMWACESFDVCFYHKKPSFLALSGTFLHTFNMKICTHKTRLEVELLCSCSLTSKVVQGNAMKFTKNLMRCVHLKDTKTLWENCNSPWWNVKGDYVDVHSMSCLMVGPLLFHSS